MVGSSSDPLEKDADEIAAKFMRYAPVGGVAVEAETAPTATPVRARRQIAEPVPSTGAFEASDVTQAHIAATRGSGKPLPDAFRTKMESMTGTDLAGVSLHADAASAATAATIGAKAFAAGSDIYFGAGASPSDTELLAHEVAHVVQQRNGGGPVASRISRTLRTQPDVRSDTTWATEKCVDGFAERLRSPTAKAVRAKRASGLTPEYLSKAIAPTYQQQQRTPPQTKPIADAAQQSAALDLAVERTVIDSTESVLGFRPETVKVEAGALSFAQVQPVAALASNPLPSSNGIVPR